MPRGVGRREGMCDMRIMLAAFKLILGIVMVLGLAVAGFVVRNLYYDTWDAWKVRRAGFTEKQAVINGTTLAVPVKVRGFSSFPVRAYAVVSG